MPKLIDRTKAPHSGHGAGRARLISCLLMLIALFSAHGLAESYPESAHPYAENSDITWTYTHPEAAYALKITFSADTALEQGFDFLAVTGDDGVQQKFTGTSLQGKTVFVLGSSFTLRLTSDSSVNEYGFTVTAVEAAAQAEYEAYVATPKYTISSAGVITAYSGLVAELFIPPEIDGVTVTGIGSGVFRDNTTLVSVGLPGSVTQIGDSAFRGCSNLAAIALPEGLTGLGSYAFTDCSSLTAIALPDGVTGVSYAAFDGCSSLASVALPDGITAIANYAFRDCAVLDGVVLPDGLERIGNSAFYNCTGLSGIVLPDSVTEIGSYAFSGCTGLSGVTLSRSLTAISNFAFRGCTGLTSVDLPAGITSIGFSSFERCTGLTSVTLPEGLTAIDGRAFGQCELLRRIELPDSIESLGAACFPSGAVLVFGSNEVIEAYALQNGHQYISDTGSAVSDGIADQEAKIAWIVDTYTSAAMSEYEKALRLHDWLCTNVRYDHSAANGSGWSSDYNPYYTEGAVLGGWAVCSGYAYAYQALLEKAGIEAKYVLGDNHAWNILRIDGKWYHVDVTWDDSDSGASYSYFGLSDLAIHQEPENHATQYTYRHLVCDSWAANYHYRNGDLDAALASLRSAINEQISAGTYSGSVTLDYSDVPPGQYSAYTIALILNNDTDWAVTGCVEITPDGGRVYSFVFHPDEAPVSDILVEGIDLSADMPERYCMYPGYAAQLNVHTQPSGASVAFASSDESVLTVSQDGLVTAVASGEACITLTAGTCTREFSIRVVKLSASGLLNTYATCLDVGETCQLELNGRYAWFLTDGAAVMASADEAVAIISPSGLITAAGYGRTTVTYTTAAGVTASVTVSVRRPVTSVVFDQAVYESYTGLSIVPALHAEGCDQNAYKEDFGHFTYAVSDTSVASCSSYYPAVWIEDGAYWQYNPVLRCLSPGEITLTATAQDGSGVSGSGVSGSCTIIIREAPVLTSIAFSADACTAIEGQIIDLVLRTQADDPDFYRENYGSFTYASSDETVAAQYSAYSPQWNEALGCWEYTVRVRCLAPGEVTFTATARDGSGVSAACTISVTAKPQLTAIAFEPDACTAMEGETIDLILRTQADDPDYYKENYGTFTYASSDETVAARYASYAPVWNETLGCWEYPVRVRCLTPGEATFTATARDGSGVSAACAITVQAGPKLTSIVPNAEAFEGYVGTLVTPSFFAYGEDVDYYKETYEDITYTFSDNTIARCTSRYYPTWNAAAGCWVYRPIIELLAPGTVTVTATARDGSGVSAACTITVKATTPLEAIVFESDAYTATEGQIIDLVLRTQSDDPDSFKETCNAFTFSSSDETVATKHSIYASPLWNEALGCWEYTVRVSCLAPGEVTFTATARDGSGVSGSCTIVVTARPRLNAIVFEPDVCTAVEGETIDLILRTQADDPDYYKENYGSFTYASSDETVATRYATYTPVWNEALGCWEYRVRIRCLAPGEVTFTATARDGSGVSGSCTIVVTSGPKLTSIVPGTAVLEGYEGGNVMLTLYAYGEDVDFYRETYGNFTFTFSDDAIARYYGYYAPAWNDEAGCWVYRPIIRLLAPGEVTVTATAKDGSGVSAACSITVKAAPRLTALAYQPPVYEGRSGDFIRASLYAETDDPNCYREVYGSFAHQSDNTAVASVYGSYSDTWSDADSTWVYHPAFLCRSPGIATITSRSLDPSSLTTACRIIVRSDSPFVLPASVRTIKSEAFLSTTAEEIVLPEGVEVIGSRAFADSDALRLINLPASLTSIAEDAFENSGSVCLICAENSVGQRFAESSGLVYLFR